MTTARELRFAPWVAPLATQYADAHAEAARVIRTTSAAELRRPTGDAGWTGRDELVHIAASTADFVAALGTLVRDGTLDLSAFADIDARNAANLDERRTDTQEQIANAIERDGRVLQELLTRLSEDDESLHPAGAPFPLKQMLEGFAMHAPHHLALAQAALDGGSAPRLPAWIEPIAAKYRAHRAEMIAFARALPPDAWGLASPDAGWTCHDLLAHVAGDTGKNLHAGLRAIIAQQSLSPALFTEFDERNARDVADRRVRSIAELIAELVADGDETQRLLAQLRADAGGWHIEGLQGTLAEALDALAEHDAVHLAQLREATAARREATATR